MALAVIKRQKKVVGGTIVIRKYDLGNSVPLWARAWDQ